MFGHTGAVKALTSEHDWKTLVSHLPADYEQLAIEHRLLNPQWPNMKVKSAEMLLRLILLHAGADLALRQTVAIVAKSGGPSVTQVWLHQKMRRAQPYLAALVERMTVDVEQEASPERWAGYEMLCLDATTVSGPGAEGVDARIHATLRLHDLRICEVHVTDATEGETLRRFGWMVGQLVIVDRGYSNAPGILHVVDQGADVLARLNRGALPLYDEDDGIIDPLAWCRHLSGHRVEERAARIAHGEGGARRVLRGRLIGMRLPEKEAEEARVRVRREHGRSVTEEQLEAAAYVMLFTTVPSSRLSATRCVDAYRLRWQIEKRHRATYADVEAAPPNTIAELIGGSLHVMPRPAPRPALASSALGAELGGPFQRGRGGPGGWWILDEPELHFPTPADPGEIDVVVPDLAGWRRTRMPKLPETAHFTLAPDWVCEVLSKSTEEVDRGDKMDLYAREGVGHVWLVDPIARRVEVLALVRGRWAEALVYEDEARVRPPPFEAFELELSALWA